ncbi:MAG: hypothetical protein L6V93_07775 [Clostridiales bacterium]|nr:MAG: hypothetical protein L6V93_07775 [Clostridiales bacterium]
MCDDKSKADEIAKTLEKRKTFAEKRRNRKIFERADEIITQKQALTKK